MNVHRRLSGQEELARLHEILQTLPPKCREAFELKKFQDFSQRRIAEHMGIAESTVEKHLRSEEHTSELQSLMRISYAVFCLKKKIQIDYGNTDDKTTTYTQTIKTNTYNSISLIQQ